MSAVASSHVTLHYRISLDEPPHAEVLSTFGGNPATLVLGSGELAGALEDCLVGIEGGQSRTFLLPSGQAFGAYRDELLKHVPEEAFPESVVPEAGQVIEFSGPDGMRLAGLVRETGNGGALVDFNHPLAGRPIRFEVQVLAVL